MSVLICLSVAIVGASYGVTAGSAGFSLWQLLALAVLVLGASSGSCSSESSRPEAAPSLQL
ncbi:hypothetical protein ACETU7_06855 [Rhodococcus sp. 3Y1]